VREIRTAQSLGLGENVTCSVEDLKVLFVQVEILYELTATWILEQGSERLAAVSKPIEASVLDPGAKHGVNDYVNTGEQHADQGAKQQDHTQP